MNVDLLREALQDKTVSGEATRVARSVAVSAREETQAMLERMDTQVQLKVAKAVGATVTIRSHDVAAG